MADTLVELQNNSEGPGCRTPIGSASWSIARSPPATTAATRRLSSAKLRQTAAIVNVDYRTARGLDRSLFQTLATCQWIRDANHLVIVGPTGTGKSWLACALKACRDEARSMI
ncbi:ATP-binding protein [Bradyrhizobium yuanmingense]|uniref:ATP-binding protein n=1 Tax=Bradyrhizobium yuanmingense TaxID=108015 RepID=UPI0023B945EF|nr:ATP-binding protein [Bradyrhizobium yuanmingense]MDF0499057.1 ATP-binding protein [Bradyrhizobium yuanmingense]